ncbi:MAG: Ig-like domain-containing protein, partial [Planctomycetota bacterium]
ASVLSVATGAGEVPVVNCVSATAQGVGGAAIDCRIDPDSCGKTIITQTALTLIGCIPFAGGPLAAGLQCGLGVPSALSDLQDCMDKHPNGDSEAAEEYEEVWFDQMDIIGRVHDVQKWIVDDECWDDVRPDDNELFEDIVKEIEKSVDENSEEGTQLSDDEVSEITGRPLPVGVTPTDVERLARRFERFANQGLTPEESKELEALANRVVEVTDRLESKGWTTAYDGFTVFYDQFQFEMATSLLGGAIPEMIYRGDCAGAKFGGETLSNGRIRSTTLRANTPCEIRYVHPVDRKLARLPFTTGGSGSRKALAEVAFAPPVDLTDTDGDGLVDELEEIVGTDPTLPDTDDDGIEDPVELAQGTDPLDGVALRVGVISTVGTVGDALDVSSLDGLVSVAEGEAGVSIFSVFEGMEPILLSRVDTPGLAQGVSSNAERVVVADGAGGLTIVDVREPAAITLEQNVPAETLGGEVRGVAVAGRVAWCALSTGDLVSVDAPTGGRLGVIDLSAPVEDVAIEGRTLWAVTAVAGNRVEVHTIDTFSLEVLGSIEVFRNGVATPRVRIAVSDGIAYVTHATAVITLQLNKERVPSVLASDVTQQVGWRHAVPNGTGLVVAAMGPNSGNGPTQDVSTWDFSDPTVNDSFIQSFSTPGSARAVSIYGGLAYVADSARGLQVINYLARDTGDVPPTVEFIGGAGVDLESLTVEENQEVRILARVTDDVQVRTVEFLLDGESVVTDGNAPFEVAFRSPALNAASEITLLARATDTGGNVRELETTLSLVPDSSPPVLLRESPRAGTTGDGAFVFGVFSEQLDPATISNDSLTVENLGGDLEPATGDEIPVPGTVSWDPDLLTLSFLPETELAEGLYRAAFSTDLEDLSGNALEPGAEWTFFGGFDATARLIERGQTLTDEGAMGSEVNFLFSATAGEGVFLRVSGRGRTSNEPAGQLTLRDPNGVEYLTRDIESYFASGYIRFAFSPETTGTWIANVRIDSESITPYDVEIDDGIEIETGEELESTLDRDVHRRRFFFFTGSAGDLVSTYYASDTMNGRVTFWLGTETGQSLGGDRINRSYGLGPLELPIDGVYIMTLGAVDAFTAGDAFVSVTTVAPPTPIDLSSGDAEVTGTYETSGKQFYWSVDLEVGKPVSFRIDTGENLAARVLLYRPTDDPFWRASSSFGSFATVGTSTTSGIDPYYPQESGQHLIRVFRERPNLRYGDFTVGVLQPEPETIPLGDRVDRTIADPYDFGWYRASVSDAPAAVLQLITINLPNYLYARVRDSSGASLAGNRALNLGFTGVEETGVFLVPDDDEVRMEMDGTGANTGDYGLRLVPIDAPEDITLPFERNDSIDQIGDRHFFRFAGTAGQTLTLDYRVPVSESMFGIINVWQEGSTWVSSSGLPNRFQAVRPGGTARILWELPATSNYIISVDAHGGAIERETGAYELDFSIE